MTDMAFTTRAPASAVASGAREAAPRLVRWGARAAVAAPVVAVFSIVAGVPIFADDLAEAAGSGRWVLVTATGLVVLLLLGLGLLALYLAQEPRLGTFGHASALLALAGTVLAAGGAWDSVFAVPYLAEEAPAILDQPTSGSLLAGYVLSYAALVIGWGAFAVATLRARVLPRGAAIALLCGAVLAFVPAPTPIRLLVLSVAAALLGRAVLGADRRSSSSGARR